MQISVDGYFIESIDISSRRPLSQRHLVIGKRPDDNDEKTVTAPTLQEALIQFAYVVSRQDVGKK